MMVGAETPPGVSVVVPVHNERENLPELYRRLTDTLRSEQLTYQLLFVDDGSTDDSTQVLRDLARRDPAVGVVVLAGRFGQLAATLCGLARARGQAVVTMDADLQHPPEAVPRLLAALAGGYDAVFALREGPGRPRPLSRLGRWLLRWVFGVRVPRDLSTLRAFEGDLARELAERGPEVVLLGVEAMRSGARIGYLPMGVAPRERGVSKYTGGVRFVVWLAAVAAYGAWPWRALLGPVAGRLRRALSPDYQVKEVLAVRGGGGGGPGE